jgi:hypothetical protein
MTEPKKPRGGSRPRQRPDDARGGSRKRQRSDDARGGARPGSGPRWRRKLAPFIAEKGNTTSVTKLIVNRCNACGCLWWEPYQENVVGVDSIERIEHPGQLEVHTKDCPMKKV